MKKSIYFLAGICIILCCQNCRQPSASQLPAVDRESEMLLIEETITNSICWAMDKDTVKLYGSLVGDSSLFIINPDSSYVRGIEMIRQVTGDVWLDERFKATECLISHLRIGLGECGTVAWFSCLLQDIGEWDGQAMGWYDTRWTGVLEKKYDNWRIVQMHFSFASD